MEKLEPDTHTLYAPAGTVGPWRSVQEMLRRRHEEAREAIAALIAAREATGVPLDDEHVDWREPARARAAAAWSAPTREAARAELRAALQIADGGLRPLPPFRPLSVLDGFEVQLCALGKGEEARLRAPVVAAVFHGDDHASAGAFEAFAAQAPAVRAYVQASLRGVRRLQLEDGEQPELVWQGPAPAEVLDELDQAGVIFALYEVAVAYQDLSPLRRRGFGSPHPSTSPSSTAAPVPPPGASPSAVTRTSPGSPTSPASASVPRAAPWPTSARVPGSETRSVTSAPAMGGPDSQSRA